MTTPTLDRSAPLLALDEFRRIMNFHPWHFWQLADSQVVPVTSHCPAVVYEHAWQNVDAVGREDVREAITSAERMLKEHLGYAVAPQYESDELPFPQYFDPRNEYLNSADALGRWLSVRTRWGHVQNVGAEALTLINTVAVTLSDTDGDTLNDTFTVSAATSVTEPSQIAAYFTSADRYDGSDVSDRWRIRPVTVTISGGVATIKGRAWSIVRPVLYEGAGNAPIDPTISNNFAAQLVIYRRATDTTQQGEFIWETSPGGACVGCGAVPGTLHSADPSAVHTQTARYTIRNSELGYVAGETAEYDATTMQWIANGWGPGYSPVKARVNYLAGRMLSSPTTLSPTGTFRIAHDMDERMKMIVARLAAAELPLPVCGCDVANRELSRWQFDLARNAGANDEAYQIAFKDLENPFGTRRGHVYAWKQLQQLRLIRDVAVIA